MLLIIFLGYYLSLMYTGELKFLYGIRDLAFIKVPTLLVYFGTLIFAKSLNANLNQRLLFIAATIYKEQKKNKEIL